MPYCTNCSSEVSNTASFCPECGSKLAARVSESSEVNARTSCPSCGSGDKLRWSVLNKSWICDSCGHSFGTSGGFTPPRYESYEHSTVSYREGGFPFSKAIAGFVILLVIGTAIGVPLWWYLPTYPLIVGAIPTEAGVTTGSGGYNRNTDVQITANPSECFEFISWNGTNIANPSSSSTTVHIGSNSQLVTAIFERYCIPPSLNHEYWEYFGKSPSYIILHNNDEAANPSWSQLKTFLREDKTDQEIYVEDSFVCTDFSQELHDNSEMAGIKAAYVEVNFVGEEIGHALNAFVTTDRTTNTGIIFIDCTGDSNSRNKDNNDKLAYVEVGKEYGLISLDFVKGFSYKDYERYLELRHGYEKSIELYNQYVETYNQHWDECDGTCTYEIGRCSCQSFESEEKVMDFIWGETEKLGKQVGERSWETMGVVEEVTIWW